MTIIKIYFSEEKLNSQYNDFIQMSEHIASQIPFIKSLILTGEKTIEVETIHDDDFTIFIKYIVSSIVHDQKPEQLKTMLDVEFENEKIITYLQYLGMDSLFNKLYPFFTKIKTIKTINEMVMMIYDYYKNTIYCVTLDQYDYSFNEIKCIGLYIFEDHQWIFKNDYSFLRDIIEIMIGRHFHLIDNNLKNVELLKKTIDQIHHRFTVQSHYKDFINQLDDKKIIGFKNGIYDCEENIFRDGMPIDFVSNTTGYNYSHEYSSKKDDLTKLLDLIFPDKYIKERMLKCMSKIFDTKKGFVFSGDSAGKNTFIELIMKTFGFEYCCMFSSDLLATNIPINPSLIKYIGKRILVCDYSESKRINRMNFKALLDEEVYSVRPLYGNIIHRIMRYNVIINIDNASLIRNDNVDRDIKHMMEYFEFWKHDPVIEKEIMEFNKNISEYREDFMMLLLEIRRNNQ